MNSGEIDTAIQRAFDGTITDAECLALRAILKSDPAARALYLEHAGLHQALIYRLSRSTAIQAAAPLSAARRRVKTRRGMPLKAIAAAAVIFGAGIVLKMVLFPTSHPAATCRGALGSRFTIGSAGEARVGVSSEKLENGVTVRLDQGALEVVTRKGTRGIVLAPATFRFQAENRVFLEQGTARFTVSKKDRGFQVATPRMAVTDFGTEFGIISQPEGANEVHVFSGEVAAGQADAGHAGEKLVTGQARSCDPVGSLKEIALRPTDFLSDLPRQSSTGLIANGDFECGNEPPDHRFGRPASAALVPSWTCGTGITVALRDDSGKSGYGESGTTVVSSTADVQVGFNDDTVGRPSAAAVSIRQSFPTEPGTRYSVRFEMGAFFSGHAGPLEITARVHDGTDLQTGGMLGQMIEQRLPSRGNGYNSPAGFTFTAASTTATLVFTETSPNTDDADPVLDNISVKEVK